MILEVYGGLKLAHISKVKGVITLEKVLRFGFKALTPLLRKGIGLESYRLHLRERCVINLV
ncbi:MAG: hypothetical protein NZ954_05410 [Thermofilaceae archaeon]|nr:hypothetical protein [Thermofilaceae archaeon]MCX8180995.1 hypothetical protein [Thermofilaceae archaeon]MDW8004100.1 hypothetical protein [Thermofilaceae archaeon]